MNQDDVFITQANINVHKKAGERVLTPYSLLAPQSGGVVWDKGQFGLRRNLKD